MRKKANVLRNKPLSFIVIGLIILVGAGVMIALLAALGASSLLLIKSSSVVQSTPVIEIIPATDDRSVLEEYNLIPVENVEVQVGQGSPIPVEVVASGTWPDLCAQIAAVQSNVNGFNIDITVLASTVNSCPPDRLGLPFRFAIPLNIVEMEAGTYNITVNGISTTFDLPVQP